jgi:nucleoside-diphosphate-sugar epimerase
MTVSGATEGKILVTGASGLAGSAVIREFVRSSYPVRALVRNRTDARTFEAFPTVEVVEGDMLRPEALTEALSGVDRVLLISSSDQQMVENQSAFIDAAKNSSVQHIVKFSGLSAADVETPFVHGGWVQPYNDPVMGKMAEESMAPTPRSWRAMPRMPWPGSSSSQARSGELVATYQPAQPTVGKSTQIRSWSARSGAR